jgi:hypothetical protein
MPASRASPSPAVLAVISMDKALKKTDEHFCSSEPKIDDTKNDPCEFFTRFKGTLPEVITPSELQTLNSALGALFAPLREIRPMYQSAEAKDRRLNICVALSFYIRFIQLFQKPLEEGLDVPIIHLNDALIALNNNLVLPILKPIRKKTGGRSESSNVHKALKGLAAATVTYLRENGFKAPDAHKELAKWLNKLGVRKERGSDDITFGTIRNWCDEVSSDFGRRDTAARMCDKMLDKSERTRLAEAAKKVTPKVAAHNRLNLWVTEHSAALRKI